MDLTMVMGTRAQAPWWSEVTPEQRRTLLAAWAGWVLDAFDFTILLLVLANIAGTFGVSLVAMGAVITGTLFCRLIGGVLVGTWADRVGRRLPLMVSIIAFSFFELLSGFAPNYSTFLILRLLFGVGMGGEWAAGTPLAMESWPQRSRGIASGFLQGGWPVGYLLATIVYFVVFPMWGWRALFWVGALPALLVLYIRRRVPESPVWLARREKLRREGRSDQVSLLRLFRPDLIGTTLHAFLVMGAMMFSYYAISSFWPTFLSTELHLTVGQKTLFLVLLNLGSIAGYWTAGPISERLGRRTTLVLFAIVGLAFIPWYALTLNHTQVLIGGILEGAIGVGLWGVAPAYLAERFPTAARGAGPGAAYHVGAAIGSFTPTLQALFHRGGMSLGQSIGITIAMALVALAIVVAAGPEPRGRVFSAEA
ncbi:MAG TPA: MFS transporter [bacterium]